ncbi:MAG: hypothetical protein ACRDZO_27715 [Egibacteraceae bacterium]
MTTTIEQRLAEFAAMVRATGKLRSPAIEAAFRQIPRHRFIVALHGPDERVDIPRDGPVPEELLDAIYSDMALLTHLAHDAEGTGCSSSSQPSLMAKMLDTLDLAPGMRVLEIGAGTGYNAALVTTITGAEVVTVDVNPTVVAEARDSLGRLGLLDRGPQQELGRRASTLSTRRVSVIEADGYPGHEARGPYARVIVTVACTGFSPHWLDQLEPGGLVLAPIAHGGLHPVTTARDRSRGRAYLPAWFMAAAGPLFSRHAPSHAPVARQLEISPVRMRPLAEPLDLAAYCDLWFSLAVGDPRVCAAYAEAVPRAQGMCAVVDSDEDAVFVQRDALHSAGDPALLDKVQRAVQDWEDLGRPHVGDWSCSLAQVGPAETPLLMPTAWTLERAGDARRT